MKDILIKISDDFPEIFFVKGQRNGKYPYSHSMLLKDTLIDTGISSGFLRKLKRKIKINNVILSHWHEDHICGNRLLSQANFMAHKEDIHIIEDISKMYEYYHVSNDPEQIELFDAILQGLRLKNTTIDSILSDKDIIEINDLYELQVIHTPGHTKGHSCFYEKNSKIIFLADIDLSSFGPWYGCKDSNIMEFEDSIKKLKELQIEIAVSAHKGIIYGSSNIQNQLEEYLKKIYQRDEKILKFLSENSPKTLEDLANKNIIYSTYSEYKIYEILAEKIMIKSHLTKLLKENKISQKNNGYILS